MLLKNGDTQRRRNLNLALGTKTTYQLVDVTCKKYMQIIVKCQAKTSVLIVQLFIELRLTNTLEILQIERLPVDAFFE